MECLIGFGAGFASQLGQSVIEPIGKQIGYVVFYSKNINNLKTELEKLEARKLRIQGVVDEDRKKGRQIAHNVEEWLCKVAIVEKELQGFFEEVNKNKCIGGCNLNLASRRSSSKRATTRTAYVKSLNEEKFEIISYPATLPKLGSKFIQNTKVTFDMQNLKRFPKIKDVRFTIPIVDLTVRLK